MGETMISQMIKDTSQLLQKAMLPSQIADNLAVFLVLSTLLYCIASVVILIGRFTKKVHNVVPVGLKVKITLQLMVDIWFTFGFSLLATMTLISTMRLLRITNYKTQYMAVFGLLILFLMVIGMTVGSIYFLWRAGDMVVAVLSDNCKANGKPLGIFTAIYDLVSGFYWAILAVAAFSFGIALIWIFISVILLSLKSDTVYISDNDDSL